MGWLSYDRNPGLRRLCRLSAYYVSQDPEDDSQKLENAKFLIIVYCMIVLQVLPHGCQMLTQYTWTKRQWSKSFNTLYARSQMKTWKLAHSVSALWILYRLMIYRQIQADGRAYLLGRLLQSFCLTSLQWWGSGGLTKLLCPACWPRCELSRYHETISNYWKLLIYSTTRVKFDDHLK